MFSFVKLKMTIFYCCNIKIPFIKTSQGWIFLKNISKKSSGLILFNLDLTLLSQFVQMLSDFIKCMPIFHIEW